MSRHIYTAQVVVIVDTDDEDTEEYVPAPRLEELRTLASKRVDLSLDSDHGLSFGRDNEHYIAHAEIDWRTLKQEDTTGRE